MVMPTQRFVAAREYREPEAYALANGLLSAKAMGAPSGFRARVTQIHLGRVYLGTGEASAAVTMIGNVPDVQAFTFSTRPAPERLLSGRSVGHGMLYRHRPNEVMYGRSPSGKPWPHATIALENDIFDRYMMAFAGRDVAPPRQDAMRLQMAGPAFQRLLALMADAARVAAATPRLVEFDAACQALSGAMMDALAACLAEGDVLPDRAAARTNHRLMGRLERVLDERAAEMLSLSDICKAVGVAERSLNLASREFLGMGVMRHVRNRRLDLVQAALLAANPGRTSIADIAMQFGFSELGRFAGAYRQRFGELPSATLRRRG
jgi:AraC-like DNA-binding protein